MDKNKSQKGQAIILLALGVVVLIGFTALAVDGGRVFSDKRNAQNAADTAALAAALAEIHEDPAGYETKGLERADSNGYNNDADSTVTVNFCSDSGVTCTGLPSGADPSEYIVVKITSDVAMTFARVLGRQFVTNRVEAITRVQGTTTNNVFSAGAGLVGINNSPSDDCFKVNGSADLILHNSGIFVNCTGNSALFLNGSANIGMDANAQVAGCANNPSFPITGTGQIDCGADQKIATKATFANVPTTLPPPQCTTPGVVGNPMQPGAFNTSVTISSTTTFNPGAYCFINGAQLKLMAGASIKGTGKVQIVTNQDISLKGSANDFDNLEIYMNNATFDINGNLDADRFRFFGTGTGSFSLGSQGTFNSTDTYIYSEAGTIEFDAQASANMHAPTSGDFAGLLLYMPWDNPNDFELNGGANNTWYGTVLMPSADVTYNGGSGFELHGQVIAYNFKINGGGSSDIFYESSETYVPPNDPTIEFTK